MRRAASNAALLLAFSVSAGAHQERKFGVVGVLSADGHAALRQAQRKTWIRGVREASAKDKGPKKPEPTPEQRTEIRQLMRRAVGGRHEARRSEAATKLGRMGPVAEMAVPSLVQALKEGTEDVYVGDVAKEVQALLKDNPKGLERELGQ